jgi:hypothetical protein
LDIVGNVVGDTAKFESGNATYGMSTAITMELGDSGATNAGALKIWGNSSGYALLQATTNNLHIDTFGGGTFINYYDGSFLQIGSVIQAPNGSQTSPSYHFTNDTNTGMFLGTTDELAFSTAGSERLRIDNTGLVGIGTTNPSAKLDVNGNTIITGSLTLSGSGHYVTGNVDIDGTLSATAKSFDIPHPTKDGMRLRYGSLESPYHGIRLTGDCSVVNGECLIYLPDYVSSLCKQEGSNVQVTNKKHGKVLWVEEINVEENYFIIKTDVSGDDENTYDFYWSFTAIRKDIDKLVVEY